MGFSVHQKSTKLSECKREEILSLFTRGVERKDISKITGVSYSKIGQILRVEKLTSPKMLSRYGYGARNEVKEEFK